MRSTKGMRNIIGDGVTLPWPVDAEKPLGLGH